MQKNKSIRIFVIGIILLTIASIVGGCSLNLGGSGGGSSSDKKPEVSKEEIKSMVDEQLKTEDIRKEIQESVKNTTAAEIMNTLEGKKVIQNQSKIVMDVESKRLLKSKDFQKAVEEEINKIMQSSDMKKKLDDLIKSSLIRSLQSSGSSQGGSQGSSGEQTSGGGSSGGQSSGQ